MVLVASASVGLCVTHAVSPQPPALSEFPLVWSDQVIPNFLITLDDSRSMLWGFLPDTIYGDVKKAYYTAGANAGQPILDANGYETPDYTNTLRVHSIAHNALAYDPNVTYLPPRRPDGSRYPNASFTAAQIDGFEPFMADLNGTPSTAYRRTVGHNSSVVNLATSYQMTWYYPKNQSGARAGQPAYNAFANAPQPAFYSVKNTSSAYCNSIGNDAAYQAMSAAAKTTYDTTCFTKVVVPASQRQNFANWYSYSRTRILGAITGLVSAVSSTSSDLRATCQTIASQNTVSQACHSGTIPVMKVMDPAGRSELVQKLINTPAPGETPLREAMGRAINYFQRTDAGNPWSFDPTNSSSVGQEYSCRQSYHLLVTDGAWNGNAVGDYGAHTIGVGDQDSSGVVRPYLDTANPSSDTTLADLALYAWKTDLRPDLANNVPKRTANPNPGNPTAEDNDPANDPAKHQHLVTFTVGFGIKGALDPLYDLPALTSGAKSWTPVWDYRFASPIPNDAGRVDDLWHAAVNSRGTYFSAQNPTALATSIQSVIDKVTKGTATGSSASSSSSVASTSNAVYITSYTGGSWTGDVAAYPISAAGIVSTTPTWNAKNTLATKSPASRRIYTWEGSNRYAFTYGNMSNAMQAVFNQPIGFSTPDGLGAARVDFVRGVRTGELVNGGTFRNRGVTPFGDVVNSSATFVGAPIASYDERIFTGYTAFANANKTRAKMLYVGANDGMLHAFQAANGNEAFAIIPGPLLAKTRALPEVAYAHKSFVDATPIAADVKVGGWKTMLFAPYGTGAKGLFALDVTSPGSAALTPDSVKWDISGATSSQIGYITGTPQRHPITGEPRIVGKYGASGNWAVFLPNGYNSDYDENGIRGPGDASLIVADLGTASDARVNTWTVGTNLHVIPTTSDGAGPYNGLSMPTGVDINGDGYIDVLYAGDLKGNLWKFEMTDRNTAGMPPKAINTIVGKRLFQAVSATGTPQPITVAPAVIRNGDGNYVVVFGTGRLLTTADKTRPPTGFPQQSLYGIVDDGGATEVTRAQLFAQKMTFVSAAAPARRVDPVAGQTGPKRGWRLDLDSPRSDDEGERVISNPTLLQGGAVIFATSAPSIDACSQVGTGWTMALNALTGGRLDVATFDLDRNGNVSNDALACGSCAKPIYASGMQSEVGVSPAPLILSTGNTIQLITGGASRGWSSAQTTLGNQKKDANGRPLYGRINWQEIGR